MATLDIRDNCKEPINQIQWGPQDYVAIDEDDEGYRIKSGAGCILVYPDEIDDLIKALQKAKELWHSKM